MKKIVQILYSGLGGHGSVAFSIIEADQKTEFDHKLIFFGVEELNKTYEERCRRDNIDYSVVVKSRGKTLAEWKKVYQQLKKWKPDIIILHSTTLIFPLALYRKIYRCKLLFVEHTPNELKQANEKISSVFGMFFADQVALLTELYKQDLRKKLGKAFLKSKVVVIPNGIDTDKFSPAKKQVKDAVRRIGMIGRFRETKDQRGLIEAFREIVNSSKILTIELHLAGDGTTLASLKDLVRSYNLEQSILFYGNINEDEVVCFLQNMDIYVHATKGETMSTSIMQAMSTGLPVIATNVSGVSNMIDNGVTGVLYDPDDKRDLVNKMQMVLNDGQLSEQLGYQARLYATKEYSLASMFNKYKKCF